VADLVSFDSTVVGKTTLFYAKQQDTYILVKKRAKYTLDLSPEMVKRPIGF
jgi:hypothetical protein